MREAGPVDMYSVGIEIVRTVGANIEAVRESKSGVKEAEINKVVTGL